MQLAFDRQFHSDSLTNMDVILSLLLATLLASTEGMLSCNQTEQDSMQPTVTFGNQSSKRSTKSKSSKYICKSSTVYFRYDIQMYNTCMCTKFVQYKIVIVEVVH